jgi:hypothetical protein
LKTHRARRALVDLWVDDLNVFARWLDFDL